MDGILLALFYGRPIRQEGVMEKRYLVTLFDEERQNLQKMVSVGKGAAGKLMRARVLLLADQAEGRSAKSDPEIAEALSCGRATVEHGDGLQVRGNTHIADCV